MKRPVSPQSTSNGQLLKKAKFAFGIFSALKKAFNAAPKNASADSRQNISNDIISSSFLSHKEPIHAHGSFSDAPRSRAPREAASGLSVQLPHDSLLSILTSETKADPKLAIDGELQHNVSPCVYHPRNPILPANSQEMELVAFESEPEFDSLYRDEDGNLVRPPFINLDPKERYQILQVKKSVQAARALQESLKYMVDPDETTSITRPGNRVDTSTQTHNEDYLKNKLHFNETRKRLALASRSNRKKSRTPFSADFLYDRSCPPNTDRSSLKLLGYLGEITKPKFSMPFSSLKKHENGITQSDLSDVHKRKLTGRSSKSKIQLDQAFIDRSNKLSDFLRVKGLTPEPATKPVGPSSGFNFEVSKDKFTIAPEKPTKDVPSLIGSDSKRADKADEVSGTSAKPLFAPPFEEGAKDDRPAKKTRTHDDAMQPKKPPTSAFSFGASASPLPTSESESLAKPDGLFGSKPSCKIPSTGSHANVTEPQNSQAQNLESITNSNNAQTKSSSKPAFSFGAPTAGSDKPPTPLFSFLKPQSSVKDSAPVFSFEKADPTSGNKSPDPQVPTTSITSKSAILSSEKSDQPKFSFGSFPGSNSEATSKAVSKSTESATPKFSFSSTAADLKPKEKAAGSLFGNKADSSEEKKSSLSFGAAENSSKNTPKPAFSFGNAPATSGAGLASSSQGPKKLEGEKEVTPNTLAGNSQEPNNGKQAIPFTFGKLEPLSGSKAGDGDTKTPFSFGKSAPSDAAAKPLFTFGSQAPTEPGAKPLVSFGGKPPTESEAKPLVSFGKQSSTPEVQPLFSSGKSNGNKPKALPQPAVSASAPTFSFGNTKEAPASNTSFNFGQSATADPSLIFGKTGPSAPVPAFNFSAGAAPKTTPLPAPQGNTSGFSFSSGVIAGMGSRSATPVMSGANFGANNPFGAGNTQGGVNNQFGTNQNNVPTFGFGGASAPGFQGAPGASQGLGERARTATPNNNANPFAFNQPSAAPGFGGVAEGGFGFSNPMSNNVFKSAPGSFGQPSRDSTPPAFGGMGGFPQASAPVPLFTPPVANISGRRIAQMRQRKRY